MNSKRWPTSKLRLARLIESGQIKAKKLDGTPITTWEQINQIFQTKGKFPKLPKTPEQRQKAQIKRWIKGGYFQMRMADGSLATDWKAVDEYLKSNSQRGLQRAVSAPPAPRPHKQTPAREAIFREQGGICHYCRVPLRLDTMTLDHKVPRAKGGRNERENYLLCCHPCNNDKADLDYEMFIASPQLRRRLQHPRHTTS